MPAKKIRVGIIGAGRVGVDWQAPDILQAGGEVIALADVAPGRAARFAQKLGAPYGFDDYRQLLALAEVDVVSICTPPVNHEEIALASFAAGKHVYLEKPPAMNEAEMARITAAGRTAGKLLLAGSNNIYTPEMQHLKRRIGAGEFGDIYMVQTTGVSRRRLPMGWLRRKSIAGGGIGFDASSHTIDHVLWLLGSPKPVSVTARCYYHFASHRARSPYLHMDVEEGRWQEIETMDTEDTLTAFIQLDNGCTWTLTDCYAANLPDAHHFWLYGSKAGATVHPLTIHGEMDGILTDTTPILPTERVGHIAAFRHLFECIRQGTETQSPGERQVLVMHILDAAYRSAAEGGRQILL